MLKIILSQLILIFISSWIYCVCSEHRKLIPKCFNSCFNGPRSTNCYCDSKCSLIYNDCCLDATYRSIRVNNRRFHNNHCIFVRGENKDFWIVDTCKKTWSGHERIKNKCTAARQHVGDTSDVTELVPVTSPKEEVTYKNYYCGLCNEANPEDLVEWQVKTICTNRDVKPEDVLQNFTYVEDKQQWGVWKLDAEGNSKFHDCFLLFQRPANVTNGIRQCISNMVSTCPSSWRNIATRRKCKSYLDPVKFPVGPIYKNIDCAICHNVTTQSYYCIYDSIRDLSAALMHLAMPVEFSAMGQWF